MEREPDIFDSIGWPKCPRCLVMLEHTEGKRGFRCPECGLMRV